MDGLRMTRDYRLLTYWVRVASRKLSKYTFDPLEGLGVTLGLIKIRQKTLMWTKHHTWDPVISSHRAPPVTESGTQPPNTSPSIQLTDFSTTAWNLDEPEIQATPAKAHSLFPPAIPTRHPRRESDASSHDLSLPIFERLRNSQDSAIAPLIQRPSDVHRSRATSRTSGEGRRSSDFAGVALESESALSPTSPSHDGGAFDKWVALDSSAYNRSGYRRANSEPGIPPGTDVRQVGLGIRVDTNSDGTVP
jgi:hypothetical protein